MALGCLVEAWMLAQKFVSPGNPKGLIPEDEWRKQNISQAVIDSRMALVKDGVVEIVGAEKNFAWLVKLQLSAVKGGQANAERFKKDQENPEPQGSHTASGWVAQPSPLYSLLSSPFSSLPAQDLTPPSVTIDGEAPPKPKRVSKPRLVDTTKELRCETWNAYADQYRIRWGREPARNAVVNTQIKTLVDRVGSEAPALVRFFVMHKKPFYVEKGHAIGLCVTDYQGLLNQMHLGREFTKADARQLEVTASNQQTLELIKKGVI